VSSTYSDSSKKTSRVAAESGLQAGGAGG